MIKIQELTDKVNELVDKFNNHTHTLMTGDVKVEGSAKEQANIAPITVPAITSKAQPFSADDYEDSHVTH